MTVKEYDLKKKKKISYILIRIIIIISFNQLTIKIRIFYLYK